MRIEPTRNDPKKDTTWNLLWWSKIAKQPFGKKIAAGRLVVVVVVVEVVVVVRLSARSYQPTHGAMQPYSSS